MFGRRISAEDGRAKQTRPKEAKEMLSSKIRTIIIGIVTSAGLMFAALVPAASQAQWHNYCIAGKCITHSNYNYANPCATGGTAASLTPEAQKKLEEEKKKQEQEEKEGKVHGEEVEKFFYGCEANPTPPTGNGTVSPPSTTIGLAPEVSAPPTQPTAPARVSSVAIL
jgi:hypothetical protein